MASTLTLLRSLNWSGSYLRYQPQTIGVFEPAVTNGNLIKKTIMGAPFSWAWNRAEVAVSLTPEVQDYTIYLPTFGFLEKAWITTKLGVVTEIEIKIALSGDSTVERPKTVAAVKDDNAGNITFRVLPSPDQSYTLTLQMQQKPKQMVSVASRWDPIPDELSYIFDPGFLALGLMIVGDGRFEMFNDRFIAHLLGAQDGLDELQKNIFLASWLEATKQLARASQMPAQGMSARAR